MLPSTANPPWRHDSYATSAVTQHQMAPLAHGQRPGHLHMLMPMHRGAMAVAAVTQLAAHVTHGVDRTMSAVLGQRPTADRQGDRQPTRQQESTADHTGRLYPS